MVNTAGEKGKGLSKTLEGSSTGGQLRKSSVTTESQRKPQRSSKAKRDPVHRMTLLGGFCAGLVGETTCQRL